MKCWIRLRFTGLWFYGVVFAPDLLSWRVLDLHSPLIYVDDAGFGLRTLQIYADDAGFGLHMPQIYKEMEIYAADVGFWLHTPQINRAMQGFGWIVFWDQRSPACSNSDSQVLLFLPMIMSVFKLSHMTRQCWSLNFFSNMLAGANRAHYFQAFWAASKQLSYGIAWAGELSGLTFSNFVVLSSF